MAKVALLLIETQLSNFHGLAREDLIRQSSIVSDVKHARCVRHVPLILQPADAKVNKVSVDHEGHDI